VSLPGRKKAALNGEAEEAFFTFQAREERIIKSTRIVPYTQRHHGRSLSGLARSFYQFARYMAVSC